MVLDGVNPRPEGASLLYDSRIDLLRCSVSLGNTGDSEPPDILYETCACIIILQLHACPLLLKHSTINLSLLHLKIASETPSQGTVMTSQCMKLVLVSLGFI